MTACTLKTERNGRNYEVDVYPENRDKPFSMYVKIYRMRKNGTRGMQLISYREDAWDVWEKVRDQANALNG